MQYTATVSNVAINYVVVAIIILYRNNLNYCGMIEVSLSTRGDSQTANGLQLFIRIFHVLLLITSEPIHTP